MSGIIGKKIGMTSIYGADGRNVACTVIEAGPCVVTQVKNEATDGYKAIQLSYDERKDKNTPKALKGHFAKAKTTPKKKVVEFRDFREEFEGQVKIGDKIMVGEVFKEASFLMQSEHRKEKASRVLLNATVSLVLVRQLTVSTTGFVPPVPSVRVRSHQEFSKALEWPEEQVVTE
jgi:hypothetical protein